MLEEKAPTAPKADVPARKPGEIAFALLAIVFGVLGYYFALDISSGSLSAPSTVPKMASVIIIAMGLLSLRQGVLKVKAPSGFGELTRFLLPRDVLVVLVLLALYSALLVPIGFAIDSFLFISVALIYLQRGKRIPLCLAVAAISVAALVGIFNYIFKVMLP